MKNSNIHNEDLFGWVLIIIGAWCFNQWSSYELWEIVWWFLGTGLGISILLAIGVWNIDVDDTLPKLETEIAVLELELKKAELQQDLAKLTKETA